MKINKIYSFIAILSAAVVPISCNGLLDLTPPMNEVSDNYYNTQKDMFQSLTAAYNVLLWSAPKAISGGAQNCAFEVVSEIMGDCCYAGGASATDAVQTSRVDRFTMLPSDLYPEALWHKYYTGINRCNQFLANVGKAKFDDEDMRARYTAEVLFLRAWYYFDLVRLFGNVPLILENLTPADYAVKQAEPGKVFERIANDILDALAAKDSKGNPAMLASAPVSSPEEKGRATSDAAKALLCRAWLFYTGYYNKEELPGVSAAQMISLIEEVADNPSYSFLNGAYTKDAATGVSPLWNVANKNSSEEGWLKGSKGLL